MRMLGKILLVGFYPLVRAYQQLRDSSKSVKAAYAAARDRLNGELQRSAADDPSAAFEALFVANQWTASELSEQLRAVRRTKWTAIITALVSIAAVSGVLVLAKSESLIYLMLGPVAVFATCLGLVQALKYALFEEQLRTRRLITLKRFLSDADMWKKVLS